AELDRRANRLARHLLARGVATEDVVGIHLRWSLDILVAVLAVMKVGGAYVPLDPDYPEQRLTLMLEDSRVRVGLSESELAMRLPSTSLTLVEIDAEAAQIGSRPEEHTGVSLNPEQLAYVLYTSGSSGRPKGVGISHRALSGALEALGREVRVEPSDVML